MTGKGASGQTPLDRYYQGQKCQEHPTKARFHNIDVVWAEADRRTDNAHRTGTKGLFIVPYLCPSCGQYHLTSNQNGWDVVDRAGKTKAMREMEEANSNVIKLPQRIEIPEEAMPVEEDTAVDESLPMVWTPEARRRDFLRRNLMSTTAKEYQEYYGLNNPQAARQDLRAVRWAIDKKGKNARYFPLPAPTMSAAELLRAKREAEGQELYEVPEEEMTTGFSSATLDELATPPEPYEPPPSSRPFKLIDPDEDPTEIPLTSEEVQNLLEAAVEGSRKIGRQFAQLGEPPRPAQPVPVPIPYERKMEVFNLPLSNRDGIMSLASIKVPRPMTEAEWSQMWRVLEAMKPALVLDEGEKTSSAPQNTAPEANDGS